MSRNDDAFLSVNLISSGRNSLNVLSYLFSLYTFSGGISACTFFLAVHNRLYAQLNVRLTRDKVEHVGKLYGDNFKCLAFFF